MFKYAITGASGFLGKALVRELVKHQGDRLLILTRKGTKGVHSDSETLVDMETLLKNEQGYNAQVLFHLAWEGVQNIYKNETIQYTNHTLTEQVCLCAKKLGVKKIIALGSQAEYGIKNQRISEEENLNPITLYGKEKVKAFYFLKKFCEENHIIYQWMRLFSAYGPHDHPGWFIPSVITKIIKGESPKLTAGDQVWDYLYVEDAAQALMQVSELNSSDTYNLGSGQGVKIREIALMIQNLINLNVPCLFGEQPYSKDQIYHLQANISKLVSSTGWRPRVDLKEGLIKTIVFYKNLLS